jgi:nitrogen fixation NifU-like protein
MILRPAVLLWLQPNHLANPRNGGELEDANAVAEETNPVCGDRLQLSLNVLNGQNEAARFLAYGCPPTLACGSLMAEMLEGMSVENALKLKRGEIVAALGGLSPQKQHAAALAIEVLRSALGTRPEGSQLTSLEQFHSVAPASLSLWATSE